MPVKRTLQLLSFFYQESEVFPHDSSFLAQFLYVSLRSLARIETLPLGMVSLVICFIRYSWPQKEIMALFCLWDRNQCMFQINPTGKLESSQARCDTCKNSTAALWHIQVSTFANIVVINRIFVYFVLDVHNNDSHDNSWAQTSHQQVASFESIRKYDWRGHQCTGHIWVNLTSHIKRITKWKSRQCRVKIYLYIYLNKTLLPIKRYVLFNTHWPIVRQVVALCGVCCHNGDLPCTSLSGVWWCLIRFKEILRSQLLWVLQIGEGGCEYSWLVFCTSCRCAAVFSASCSTPTVSWWAKLPHGYYGFVHKGIPFIYISFGTVVSPASFQMPEWENQILYTT